MGEPMSDMIVAKRGDLVVVEREHVATFQDSSIGRVVTRSVTVGTVWNVSRDGTAKTVRTADGYIRKIEDKETRYVVSASRIDVAAALQAAKGLETIRAIREAIRPFLTVTIVNAGQEMRLTYRGRD